jgi:hypothetical protein
VADLRTIFGVLTGADLDRAKPDQDILAGLRVAWFDGDGNIPARSDITTVVADAANRVADEGALVDFRRPPGFEAAAMTLRALRDADGLVDVERLAEGREDLLAATTTEWLASSRRSSVAELQDLAARRDALRFDAGRFMEDWPIWIMPVATIPAFELDVLDPSFAQPEFEVEGKTQTRYETMSPSWAVSLLLPSSGRAGRHLHRGTAHRPSNRGPPKSR